MIHQHSDLQTEQDAIDGQGKGDIDLRTRNLGRKRTTTPDKVKTSSIIEIPSLYKRFISPDDIEIGRVVHQLTVSADPSVAISSQLNNRINVTMDNSSLQGGRRLKR
jgi:hypothetical protein